MVLSPREDKSVSRAQHPKEPLPKALLKQTARPSPPLWNRKVSEAAGMSNRASRAKTKALLSSGATVGVVTKSPTTS